MNLHEVEARWDRVADRTDHPYEMAFLRNLGVLRFTTPVTFLVGENGSGKSTLLEAIARGLRLNAEGGTGNMSFATTDDESTSDLHRELRIVHQRLGANAMFFLRAETFFNVATAVDRYGVRDHYGGSSLHQQSHGESFLALAMSQFVPGGLYLLDEPEAALSLQGQLQLLRILHDVGSGGGQFVVATHSPILTALPGATILECSDAGAVPTSYDDSELIGLYRSFLAAPDRFLRHLLAD